MKFLWAHANATRELSMRSSIATRKSSPPGLDITAGEPRCLLDAVFPLSRRSQNGPALAALGDFPAGPFSPETEVCLTHRRSAGPWSLRRSLSSGNARFCPGGGFAPPATRAFRPAAARVAEHRAGQASAIAGGGGFWCLAHRP